MLCYASENKNIDDIPSLHQSWNDYKRELDLDLDLDCSKFWSDSPQLIYAERTYMQSLRSSFGFGPFSNLFAFYQGRAYLLLLLLINLYKNKFNFNLFSCL